MNRAVSRAVHWIRNGSEVLGRPQLTGPTLTSKPQPAECFRQPFAAQKVAVLGSSATGTVVRYTHKSIAIKLKLKLYYFGTVKLDVCVALYGYTVNRYPDPISESQVVRTCGLTKVLMQHKLSWTSLLVLFNITQERLGNLGRGCIMMVMHERVWKRGYV